MELYNHCATIAVLKLAFKHFLGAASEATELNNNNEFSVNRCDYGSLKDMPKAVLSLLKNKTYVCISIGAALDAFLLAGSFLLQPTSISTVS